MKKKLTTTILCFLSLLFGRIAFGQDLYSTVTNLWWNGPKTNVLAIAEARLSSNTNDIAGIVLQMEGELSFGGAATISNAVHRFLTVGASIQTPEFRVQYPLDAYSVSILLDAMPPMTPAEWAQEREFGAMLHREMMLGKAWSALRDDGWLGAVPPANVFDRQGVDSHVPRQWRGDDTMTGKMIMAYMVYCATRTDGTLNSAWEALHGMTDAQMLANAQQRLADEPSDLLGATMSLFYHFKRCNPLTHSNAVDRIAVLSNEVERVLLIGSTETRPPFVEHWPWMSVYLGNVQIWLSGTNAPAFEAALHYDDLNPEP